MTKDVYVVNEDDELTDLTENMIANNYKSVPVKRDEKLVGIVSRLSLCKSMMEEE